jgi:hypothetical protein
MRAEPESIPSVSFWEADRLLVATDHVGAWYCNRELAALRVVGLPADVVADEVAA